MGALAFEVLARDGKARLGRLTTAHGSVDTPAFMPVATQGSVKSLSPGDLRAAAEVALERPEFGIATGQACVFYRGSRVLGGGWIATTGSEFINV